MALSMFASRSTPRPPPVRVVRCDRQPGCFRWVVATADGASEEHSAYAYASAVGAQHAGRLRAREIRASR